MRRGLLAAALSIGFLVVALSSPAAAATVTIGANVNDTSNTGDTGCSGACTLEDTIDVPTQTMQSPCDGTVTAWRVNAETSTTFRLRLIRDIFNGTYVSTASSDYGTTSGPGIALFQTSIPISSGEFVGVDIPVPSAMLGRTAAGSASNVFRPPLVDATPQSPQAGFLGVPETALVNADVNCAPTGKRAAALKRCKKRARKHDWSRKRLRKCRKKARLLPV